MSPDAAPTVFSYGVFGLILIWVMLYFPRGFLPALGDTGAAAALSLLGRLRSRDEL